MPKFGELVKFFLDKKNIKQADLARKIGVSPQNITSILKQTKPRIDTILKVANALGVDPFELMDDRDQTRIFHNTDEHLEDKSTDSNAIDRGLLDGDFENYTTKSGNEYSIVSDGNHRMKVKVVEQVAYAGYLAGWSDPEYIETLPTTIITVKKFHTGTYRAFEVSGDSMDYDGKRAIESGDCVIAHKIDNDLWFRSKLHIHDWKEWVIVHDEGIIIKQITKHDVEKGVITCRSYNPDKNIYPDFELPLERVYELYNVVKIEKSR